MKSHKWMLTLLCDLEDYAAVNNLPDLVVHLRACKAELGFKPDEIADTAGEVVQFPMRKV